MGSKIKLPKTLLSRAGRSCARTSAVVFWRGTREKIEREFPPRPRHSLRVAAPCFYFVAIFCHGTKLNNASSKTKVKTALVE